MNPVNVNRPGVIENTSRMQPSQAQFVPRFTEVWNADLPRWDGKSIHYTEFDRHFESILESYSVPEKMKIRVLAKCLRGQAHETVRACFTKPPEIGYKLARDTLYMRYGQTHMVTSAYLKELTGGPPLRENNEKDLFQLSTTMQNAHATLVELNVAGELETDSMLKGVC